MYIDGDTEYPTIAYTGTEDYFGGAWGFGKNHLSESFSAPYFGYQLVPPPGLTDTPALHRIPGARFTLYRFCVNDPVFFSKDLRIELQLLGWRSDQRLCNCRMTWLRSCTGIKESHMVRSGSAWQK